MQTKKPHQNVATRMLLFLIVAFALNSCKKDLQQDKPVDLPTQKTELPAAKINPFSYSNILKAKQTLATKNDQSSLSRTNQNDADRLYTYLKFDPAKVTGEILKQLEADTTIKILDFPFANGEIYNDEFALDETKAKQLADGSLYAVVKKNTTTETLLKSRVLNSVQLDELFLPEEIDTTLQFQALLEAGYTQEQLNALRICLFKRPQGFVRYTDQETGQLRGVGGMQVWGLVFGIPLHTYTNGSGHYNFPWRFSLGTIMGTHAKNLRINIKPFNTQGGWIATLPLQFIVGSVHIHGWVGSCAMRNEVNFHFTEHRQNRYWAQLMDGVNLHDQYSSNDNIENAPSFLTMYAHWADRYGGASTPLLGHLQYGPLLVEGIINGLFDGNINLANDLPNIFNLLTGLLPDITIRVGNDERRRYSSRLMQTLFHELAHASYYRQVGQQHYLELVQAELYNGLFSGCGPYNCDNAGEQEYISVSESWAEYLGTIHARRLHPNGFKTSTFFGGFVDYSAALEQETFFENRNIPTGIFNDLNDVTNTAFEPWDRTGGLRIEQMYRAFEPNVTTMCNYQQQINTRFPNLNANDIFEIFWRHEAGCL